MPQETVQFGSSQAGLLTVGYQLRNEDGANNGSRITSGIIDLGGGTYTASVTTPPSFIGVIDWDTGQTQDRHALAVVAVGNNAGNSQFLMAKFSNATLTTVGYQLVNGDGSDNGSHVTSGIVNFGFGYYAAVVTVPSGFSGFITWDDGGSPPTQISAALSGPAPTPLSPGAVSVTGVTGTTAALSATEATGGSSPYTHQWQRRVGNFGAFSNLSGQTGLTLSDTGLTEGQTYWYLLVYTDSTGASVNSTAHQVTTSAPIAGSISSSSLAGTSVTLTATEATGGTAPYTHAWQRALGSGSFATLTGQTGLVVNDTGLVEGQTYTYLLTYTDAVGVTAQATIIITTPAPAAGLITVGTVTSSTASLSATEATSGTPPYSHSWARQLGNGAPQHLSATGLVLNDTGLTPGATYTYLLSYTDAAGSTVVAQVTLTTPALQGLTAGVISASNLTETSVTLTATEATGGNGPYQHTWRRRQGSGSYKTLAVTSLSFTDTTLTEGTTYTYQLVYTDTTGSDAGANVGTTITITTPGAVISTLTLPQYDVVFLGDTNAFDVGDAPSLAWSITERSGANVPAPTALSLTALRPDGFVDPTTPVYESSSSAAPTMTLSCIYAFGLPGVYTLKVQFTLNVGDGVTPSQVRSAELMALVS